MKINWNKDYNTKAVYIFIVVAALMVFAAILLNLSGIFDALGVLIAILSPFLWGFGIAYILNRPVMFFERKVFHKLAAKKPKVARALCVTICSLIMLGLIVALFWVIVPQLVSNLIILASNVPTYLRSLEAYIGRTFPALEYSSIYASVNNWLNANMAQNINELIPAVAGASVNLALSLVTGVATAFIALIASIYLLLSKEYFLRGIKKFCYAVLPEKFVTNAISLTRESNEIFSKFIVGKLTESLFVGLITFLGLTVFGIPYALLISAIMAIFNLIPFFGPFIGAVPCVLILLVANPWNALVFAILTLILQQIDGQIIGPKILGESTGLLPFWIIFAIILGGGLFGVMGMILGVPVFAVIFSVVRAITKYRLEKKGLSTDAADYESYKKK